MFLVILLGLAIPLPLAIYALILHALNRRPHPVVVPGTWDFALVLFASSSAVDTDFTGKLVDVHPTGFCQRLCDGVIRGRYRAGPERAELMEPETIYELDIDLWNTSHVFKAGHAIRLEVSSSAFPKYDRNLNTGEDIGTGTRMVTAENRVWHDAGHPSRLTLPIIPADRG